MHLLLGHMLDTAAVAELMWKRFLTPWMRWRLDEVTGGRGQQFFMWICGVHDCGKATPAFQFSHPDGGARMRMVGLAGRPVPRGAGRWRHDKAGGLLIKRELDSLWEPHHVGWVWPLVAGHHGSFPDARALRPRHQEDGGRDPAWLGVQRGLLDVFTCALGYEGLAAVEPVKALNRAEQLVLSGLIVMADWIASDHEHFTGLDDLAVISLAGARRRAGTGWRRLALRGGWGEVPVPPLGEDLVRVRFGDPARPSQEHLVSLAHELPAPALIVVEAPMGEGKTKGALAAAEVLAARFGFDGVFVAMPTQATCDPMYEQVLSWVSAFGEGMEEQVALLHGRHRFNQRWRKLWQPSDADPEDVYGSIDEDAEYGMASFECGERQGPAVWFLGRKRGLLTGFGVGTIDQLLYAATRTRHVMLRFAGLAGKVVIIDEVHAADVYMQQFLAEALRWLGQARVPVILLSATLPPSQRQALVDAYLSGALGRADVHEELPEPAGYPCVTAAWARQGQPPLRAAAVRLEPGLPRLVGAAAPEAWRRRPAGGAAGRMGGGRLAGGVRTRPADAGRRPAEGFRRARDEGGHIPGRCCATRLSHCPVRHAVAGRTGPAASFRDRGERRMTTDRRPMYWEEFSPGSPRAGAELACLRRGVGREPGNVPEMWRFHRVRISDHEARTGAPSAPLTAEHTALTLFAVHQQAQRTCMHHRGTGLGTALRLLRQSSQFKDNPAALDTRVNALATSTDVAELAHHLRGLVTLLRGIGQPLDYTGLYYDVLYWHTPQGQERTRRTWGAQYYDWAGSTTR